MEMSAYKEFSGKDVDDAIEEACRHFGESREKLEIEIVSGGSTGIFGLVGVKKAMVKARKRQAAGMRSEDTAVERATEEKPDRKDTRDAKGNRSEPKQKERSTPQQARSAESTEKKPAQNKAGDKSRHPTGNREQGEKSRRDAKPGTGRGRGGKQKPQSPEKKGDGRPDNRSGNRQAKPDNRKQPTGDRTEADGNREAKSGGRGRPQKDRQGQAKGGRGSEKPQGRGRNERPKKDNPGARPQNLHSAPPRSDINEAEIDFMDGMDDSFEEAAFQPQIGYDKPFDAEKAKALTEEAVLGILKHIIPEPKLEIETGEGRVRVHIDDPENSGLIIGRDGQTISSMQYVVNRIVTKQTDFPVRVHLDAGDYRERQDDNLRKMALYLAERARSQGRTQSTKPLSSYHRRVVHMALQDDDTITTWSKGDGPLKRVLISQRRERQGR